MRLSWPFRRSRQSPGPEHDTPSEVGVQPAPRDAWRALPPIAGTVGPTPLVAPVKPFSEALAAAAPPSPILAPLSHARSLDGPKGLVVGVARPVVASAPAVPMPVQRAPRVAGGSMGARQEGVANEPMPSPGEAGPVGVRPGPMDAGGAPPPPRLSAASAAPVGPRRDLTTASGSATPEPRAGLVGQPTAGRGRTLPAPERDVAIDRGPAPATQAPPTPPAPRQPALDVPRLTLGQTRRMGLGAPIAGGPLGTPSRGDVLSPVSPPVRPLPLRPSRGAPEADASASAGSSPQPDGQSVAPTTPDDTSSTSPASMQPAIGGALSSAPSAPLVRSAAPARAGTGPAHAPASRRPASLVSANPLRSSIQRSPTGASRPEQAAPGSTGVGQEPGHGSAPTAARADGAVRVHRGPEAARLASSLDARAFTHGSDVYLPASHGPLSSGIARSLLAHELTHVAQQRHLGSSLPAESTPHGRRLEAEAVAAERSGTLPLAMPRPASARPAASGSPTTGPQRAPETPPHEDIGTTTIHVAAGTQRAPMNGSTPRKDRERTSRTEQELEDLAHQLYARIGRRLRRELLVDRERAGLGIDLR